MQNSQTIHSFSSALNLAIANFSSIVGISFVLGVFIIQGGIGFLFIVSWLIIAGIQSYYIFVANKNFTIDMESKTITLPKSGYGQTKSWSFSAQYYWNLMKKQTINIADIQDIVLESARRETTNTQNSSKKELHVMYHLQIIGSFGTIFFKFTSREKRNEIGEAICQALKEVTGKELSCQDDYRPGHAANTAESFINNF